MVKAERNGLLILGINKEEIEHLKQGNPLNIPLADLGFNAAVMIIPGDSNEKLVKQIEAAGERMAARSEMLAKGALLDLSQLKLNS